MSPNVAMKRDLRKCLSYISGTVDLSVLVIQKSTAGHKRTPPPIFKRFFAVELKRPICCATSHAGPA